MKAISLSLLVLFTTLFAVNLDAGQGRNRGCHHHHHHHSRSNVNFSVGGGAVAAPVIVPVQQAPVVVSRPTYYTTEYAYPVTYVEYQQPVIVQSRPVVVQQPVRASPWSFFNFGFSFGN
jgi:hypothetical protein